MAMRHAPCHMLKHAGMTEVHATCDHVKRPSSCLPHRCQKSYSPVLHLSQPGVPKGWLLLAGQTSFIKSCRHPHSLQANSLFLRLWIQELKFSNHCLIPEYFHHPMSTLYYPVIYFLSLSLWICLFRTIYINAIICGLCVWLFSLVVMFPRFIHVVAHSTYFTSFDGWMPSHRVLCFKCLRLSEIHVETDPPGNCIKRWGFRSGEVIRARTH